MLEARLQGLSEHEEHRYREPEIQGLDRGQEALHELLHLRRYHARDVWL